MYISRKDNLISVAKNKYVSIADLNRELHTIWDIHARTWVDVLSFDKLKSAARVKKKRKQ